MKLHTIVLVSSLLSPCVACAPKPGDHYTVYLDPAFSAEEDTQLTLSVEDWHAMIPALSLDVVIATCSGIHDKEICVHRRETAASSAEEGVTLTCWGKSGSKGDTSGWGGIDGGEIWLDMTSINSSAYSHPFSLRTTFSHEMGHAMGLEHNSEGTVMFPDINGASITPTCEDVFKWYYVRGQNAPTCNIK